MSDKQFLKRLFQAYYEERQDSIPAVDLMEHREFGFIPWEKPIMIRHMSFSNAQTFRDYLVKNSPMHVYSSGSLYMLPNIPDMSKKQYQGCDLIIDIDVDHFPTPCKVDHDKWYCKECEKAGKGMPPAKCPKCGGIKFDSLSWICSECLDAAKTEIKKLLYDFLIPDFGIQKDELHLAFSGHRGYHLKVQNEKIRSLTSEERREIVDYVSGHNLSYEALGLRERGNTIFGLLKDNIGWSHKIVTKIEYLLITYDNDQLRDVFTEFDLSTTVIDSLLKSKNYFLNVLSKNHNVWTMEGFGLANWKKFLDGIVHLISAEIDEPVTIDIHRLIRYPGSLHGKSGFKVQELTLDELDAFTPLNVNEPERDPIVFQSQNIQKIKISAIEVPPTTLKDETYGPYKKGEVVELPNHVAVFLLCKGVAQTV
ncbi:MAG: hypothetical protein EU544_00360 [Promethearchaeota archaeon]|nr:MAG: hypothetical protein EU544_00360 [Candidatus Lokiarchaeota archaeon]